ncbi:unannotated protein [freshwater metagenome]|uniref:Unannotated protein n=1 Tax=freshwater metagenome TaxID=449393 RepID=A0A6J6DAD7_9ZZZZ
MVNRCGATLDVVHVRALISDDQGSLELTHVFGVDSEVGLKRNFYVNTLWYVDERTTGPNGRVQSSELVVTRWNNGAEVFLEDFRVLFEGCIGVKENYALFFKLFVDLVVNHFRFVLRSNT